MCDSPRDHLPTRRRCISQKIKIDGQTVHYSIGLYEDGRPGELFIDVAKAGAALRQWASDAARMLSVAIQHGTPLQTALNLFIGSRCDPSGKVEGHPYITHGLSIMDVIARDLAITFLGRTDLANLTDTTIPLVVESARNGNRATMECSGRCHAHNTSEPEDRNTKDNHIDGKDGGVDTDALDETESQGSESIPAEL